MTSLQVPSPISAGILLSYRCTGECLHCMYACSPRCPEDWMSEEDARTILRQLAGRIKASPYGPDTVGVNSGLHFTGGDHSLSSIFCSRSQRWHETSAYPRRSWRQTASGAHTVLFHSTAVSRRTRNRSGHFLPRRGIHIGTSRMYCSYS